MSKLDMNDGLSQLVPLIKQNKLIIFVGSGISVASGLPTWDELLEQFIAFCSRVQKTLNIPELDVSIINDATTDRNKYPIRVASVLRDKLKEIESKKSYNLDKQFKKWFLSVFAGKPFNKNHNLIVNTNYPYILTSNYDNLLEEAAEDLGHLALAANSFTFDETEKVGQVIYEKRPSIIHVHGDLNDIALDKFVFTAKDYVRIKKDYPGFTMAIQSLFIHYSILFVGYGGSDPHLEDFVEDICYYFGWAPSSNLPRFFLTLKHDKVNTILDNYKIKLRTDLIVLDNYDKTQDLLEALQKESPRT